MNHLFYPPPPPLQGSRFSATLPAGVGDAPPLRGMLAATLLATAIAAWPSGAEAAVPLKDLSQVSRSQSAVWYVPVVVVNAPPPRPPQLVLHVEGGIFYPYTFAIPQRLPSGLSQDTSADAPPPRVPLPAAILARWRSDWLTQSARQGTPPSGAAPAVADQPFLRFPQSILRSWNELASVALAGVSLPQDPSGTPPPPRSVPPGTIGRAWLVSWEAQSAPTFDYSSLGLPPVPRIPLSPAILRAWQRDWRAQRSAVSAAWDVPPPAAGDLVPRGRILPTGIGLAWVPRFISPPPLRTLDLASAGEAPPVLVRVPAAVLRAWVRDWQAQHATAYHDGQLVIAGIEKGFIVRDFSGSLYRVICVGDDFYAVRLT